MGSSNERRQQIIDSAARLFARYGTSKTTIADIAREAGIGVGTVYLEFPSKDAVVEVLSQDKHLAVLSAMQSAANGEFPSQAARLHEVIRARIDALFCVVEEGHHSCELVLCQSGAVQAAHQRFELAEKQLFEQIVRKGVQLGEFDCPEVDKIAVVLQSALTRFSLPHLLIGSRDDLLTQANLLVTLLLRGLVRRLRIFFHPLG